MAVEGTKILIRYLPKKYAGLPDPQYLYETEEYLNEARAMKRYERYLRSKQKINVTISAKRVFQPSPDLDRFITWWINYYDRNAMQPERKRLKLLWVWRTEVSWDYKRRNWNEGAMGRCHYRKRFISLDPYWMHKFWKEGKRHEIIGLIAHEVAHLVHPNHSPKFHALVTRWLGRKEWSTGKAPKGIRD